jgi:hypothetical protein
MLEFDNSYEHSYQVEELGDFPGSGGLGMPLFYVPQPKNRPEHNGLWLKLTPTSGDAWVGVFAFRYPSPPAFSRVVSLPDPESACVIANGGGYLVRVSDPQRWEEIPLIPILDVRVIRQHGLLLLSDYCRIAAYGSKGFVWRSPRLCWDELKIISVGDDKIEGTGYDPTNSITNESQFVVDITTGRSLLPGPVDTEGNSVW